MKGNRKGTWAVAVRANWRVTFLFEDGDACDVDLEDYHEEGQRDADEKSRSPPAHSPRPTLTN